MYGLPAGHRLQRASIGRRAVRSHRFGCQLKDNSLENCGAVCIKCHAWKTANHDAPMAAKTVRMQDKARGIRTAPVKELNGPGFPVSEKSASRSPKPSLGYRALYKPVEESR